MSEHAPVWQEIRVGPALIDAPVGWEILKDGSDGYTVLGLTSADQHKIAIDNIRPNIVLRYFPYPAEDGGVAKAHAEELRAAMTVSPGSSLIAVTPFLTHSGHTGRGHVLTGLEKRIPYQMCRWYIGIDDVVVEVALTLPGAPQPELLEMGEILARSVRPRGAEGQAIPGTEAPYIPESRIDAALWNHLSEHDMPRQLCALEHLPGLLADIDDGQLPARALPLSAAAADSLLAFVREEGTEGALTLEGAPGVQEELRTVDLLDAEGRISDKARQAFSGISPEPDLVVHGTVGSTSTTARIWFDGAEATLLLGPPLRAVKSKEPVELRDQVLLLRELRISVPTLLNAWSVNRAAWFIDVQMDVPTKELDAWGLKGAPPRPASEHPILSRALREGASKWSAESTSGKSLEWVRTEERGPLMVGESLTQGTTLLRTVSAAVIHDELTGLAADPASNGHGFPDEFIDSSRFSSEG